MIRTKSIQEIIRLALRTPFIENAKIISLFLVADAESGKTEILKRFSKIKGIDYSTDITYSGLINLLDEIEKNNVKYLIIPDFLKVTMRKQSTVSNTLGLLNAIIEEGVAKIDTFYRRKEYNNVSCGLISGITREEMRDKRHKWTSIGFLSRILPVSYSYSIETQLKIMEEINNMNFKPEFEKNFSKTPHKIEISKAMASKIQNINLSIKEAGKVYGFRRQKQLLSLALASAQERGDNKVKQIDIDKIIKLSNFINLDFNPL